MTFGGFTARGIVPPKRWIFDGIDDRVEFGDVHDIERTDSVTLSVWVRMSGANQQVIVGKLQAASGYRGWEIGGGNGSVYFILCSAFAANMINAQTAAGYVPAGVLTQIAVTYNGNTLRTGCQFYVNGNPVPMDLGIGIPGPISGTTLSTHALEIGLRAASNTLPLAGEIRHVAKFNAALTAPQILEVYNGGTPPNLNALPTCPAPVWWVKMDDGTDAVGAGGIKDHGPSANHGTAAGGLAPVA